MALQIDAAVGGCILHVKVVPNASRGGIAGVLGTELKIKVAQPPEGGRANEAVRELLAEALVVAAGRIRLVGGQTQARKRFFVQGVTAEEAAGVLGERAKGKA